MLKKSKIKHKLTALVCGLTIISFSLTGCSLNFNDMKDNFTNNDKKEDVINGNIISGQTSSLGIDLSKKGSKLESYEFYVLHEGKYYPAYYYMLNYDADKELTNYVKEDRQAYFLESNENNIPTLFLSKGDKLIYYDETNVVDYIQWERYKDLGYTVGVYNLIKSTSGRYYINIKDKDNSSIVEGAGLDSILTNVANTDNLLIDKVGNTKVDDTVVENNIITGATKGQTYSLDIYEGTKYHHFNVNACVHAFQAMEQYATIEYNPLRAYTYEIEIPDYFEDGYYKMYAQGVNGSAYTGLIRIVRNDDSFDITDSAKFNKELLQVYTVEDLLKKKNGEKVEEKAKGTYSTCKELNKFKTTVVNSFGYDNGEKDKVTTDTKKTTLSTATIRQFNINLNNEADCRITLSPKNTEPAGDIYIYIGNEKKQLVYDSIMNNYSVDLTGDGNTYTLFVSGIWQSYDIELKNCHEDKTGTSKSILSSSGLNQTNKETATNSQNKIDSNNNQTVKTEENTKKTTESAKQQTNK